MEAIGGDSSHRSYKRGLELWRLLEETRVMEAIGGDSSKGGY